MRLATVSLAATLAALPVGPRAQDRAQAEPTPAPKADAGPAAPPAAEPAPKAVAPPRAEAPAARPPPAAATDLARALLSADQWGKVLDSYASSLASQVSQALLATGEKVPDDLRGKLRAELEKALPYQQTVRTQAEALAKALTPDELRRTASFYASPLGRKLVDKLPEAQSSAAQQLQERLATAVPGIVTRLAPKAMEGSPHGGGSAGGGAGTPPVQGRRPPP